MTFPYWCFSVLDCYRKAEDSFKLLSNTQRVISFCLENLRLTHCYWNNLTTHFYVQDVF